MGNLIGVIGGSGLYDIAGLKNEEWLDVSTNFGHPSDKILLGEVDEVKVAFMPRHGRGHVIPPSDINYRANIEALKKVGVTDLISISAVGSLNSQLTPGTFVLVDQFIDLTKKRNSSFFETGLVAHVSMAHPVCHRLKSHIENVSREIPMNIISSGTYITIEGPQFSTLAESNLYKKWGCDVIGMTNMPEAKLAREAEMCYTSVAMVTDFDCWHPDHENVSVEQIMKTLSKNEINAKKLLKAVFRPISEDKVSINCSCRNSLENAIITPRDSRDPDQIKKLKVIAGRVL